ncbi:hypothetical protein PVAG01_06031 [Phlyctema vagabunda]|uniref:Uncharacterized protein n=1 Tax=Phlyctema vagabunda TaxID=108571 RepID=A0ABR4PEX6_9HELO
MSEASNTKVMDIEAGGEQTQYEGAVLYPQSSSKDAKDTTKPADPEAAKQKQARGEKTAENIRYGEAISEHGFGGETTGTSGDAQQGGFGKVADDSSKTSGQQQTRREQGYGGGSGVGA